MGGFGTLATSIASQLGQTALSAAFTSSLQPNARLTTTAINMLIVVNGLPIGLIQTLRTEENFDVHRVKAIGSPVDVALVPGVYEATATLSRAFIYGQTLENAFGGNLRQVVGTTQQSPDFTVFYFNMIVVDNAGNPIETFHDCALQTVSTAYEIANVIIIQDASIAVRWTA